MYLLVVWLVSRTGVGRSSAHDGGDEAQLTAVVGALGLQMSRGSQSERWSWMGAEI